MRLELGPENTVFVHVTLVPFIATAGELKTKPTQHSVKEMLNIGIQPDILLCRSDRWLSPDLKRKIALFCNVAESRVISAQDVDTIYAVPVALAAEGLRAGDPEARAAAAGRAGELDAEAARPLLVEALRDPDSAVVVKAAEALATAGGADAQQALLDVLTAQASLDQARYNLIAARLNARVAKANIEALIGRDLK